MMRSGAPSAMTTGKHCLSCNKCPWAHVLFNMWELMHTYMAGVHLGKSTGGGGGGTKARRNIFRGVVRIVSSIQYLKD